MSLRTATLSDIEIILRHRREMFREMGGIYAETLEQYESASRTYFENAVASGTYHGTFAEVDGNIVAGGGIVIADWPGSPQNYRPQRAWILNIYVEPAFRRRGFAKLILQTLIDWCRQNGFRSVALHASEEGRPIYERLGFCPTNEMRLVL